MQGADVNLCKCATALMDIKLGQALQLGKQPQHTQMSAEYAKQILKDLKVNKKTTELLLNAVEAHHGKVPYASKEAEIAANADCYRFISEIGVFTTYKFALDMGKSHNEALDFVQFKLDEKRQMLSLPQAKKELVPLYKKLTTMIKNAHFTKELME